MTPTNAELLYAHSKECGSNEFTLRLADGMKRYCCNKCNSQIAEEINADIPTAAAHPVDSTSAGSTTTRKAA